MLKKTPLLLLFTFLTIASFSQQKKILVKGKVTDSLGVAKNAHIINLKTNQGTFSSDDGEFTVFVNHGDSLRVSSIQHITKFIVIHKSNLNNKFIHIKLGYNTIVLDAFELKRHYLSGRLGIDSKQVPTNKKDSLVRDVLNFSNVNMKAIQVTDIINKIKPSINNTDPNAEFIGASLFSKSVPSKDAKRLRTLTKELARKKAFPYKIMSELGEKFFFEQLKIPADNYFHFLEYCNPLGIEKLHKNKKFLEIISIFQLESKTYLEIIKK